MMRVDRSPTPRGFVEKVFRPGRKWLKAHPFPAKVSPLWNRKRLENGLLVRDELAERYHYICAYSQFRILSFEVDHFLPKQHPSFRNLAYAWFNYRLADGKQNNWKGDRLDVVDPFTIGVNACILNFEKRAMVEANTGIPGWEAVKETIITLHLNDGAYKTARYDAYTRYLADDPKEYMGVVPLARDCPFVAYEMLRQGHIKERDRDACVRCLHEVGFSWVRRF